MANSGAGGPDRSGNSWALRACLLYAVVAGLWIVASDGLLARMATDYASLSRYQAYASGLFVAATAAFLYIAARRMTGGTLDAGERERSEATLRERERNYRDLFELNPSPMWVYDIQTLAMLAVNEAAVRQYGYTREEFGSLTVADMWPEEDVPELLARVRRRDPDAKLALRVRHRRKDGSAMDVEVISGPVSLGARRARLVLVNDITAQKKSEEALAREHTLLRLVVDNLPDNIYVKDHAMRYLLINRAGLRHRSVGSERDVIGRTASDFYPAELAARFDAEDRAVLERGEAMFDRERWEVSPSGERRWYLGTKVPLREADGRVIGVVGIGRDITEIRRSAEVIRRLNTELEQRVAERTAQLENTNRELEAFSYSVSHDLRAPLRSIDGFGRALLEDCAHMLDAQGREYLNRIRLASQRMAELIDDLLSLARVARSEMTRSRVDLSALAGEIAAELAKSRPEREALFDIAPGLVVEGDANLLRVALENLLNNAWKFSGRQSRARIGVGALSRDGKTVFFVRDNGAGFDMAYAGKLFGAFQRLHGAREFPGTGVGLATVQRIVHRHGGRVWAEAAVDGGATFYFTLETAGPAAFRDSDAANGGAGG